MVETWMLWLARTCLANSRCAAVGTWAAAGALRPFARARKPRETAAAPRGAHNNARGEDADRASFLQIRAGAVGGQVSEQVGQFLAGGGMQGLGGPLVEFLVAQPASLVGRGQLRHGPVAVGVGYPHVAGG